MPSKRTLAILLIIAGLLAILGVLYWAVFMQPKPTTPSQGQLPVVPTAPVTVPAQPSAPTTPPTAPPRTTNTDEQEQLLLRQKAMVFAARQGSYTNGDGFASVSDVYLEVDPTVKAFYQGEVTRLNTEHTRAKGIFTQTLRSLSSRITSDLPLKGKTQATVVVQAQQTIETGTQPAVISYQEITITYVRSASGWTVTRVEAKPLAL
jgi:hypothetical protein